MSFPCSRERERFSLDDPKAGRKLAENLDARKVRVDFAELCMHFDCVEPEDKIRLHAKLAEWVLDRLIVEADRRLYCRPALSGKQVTIRKERRVMRNRRPRGSVELDRHVALLLDFVRAQKADVTTKMMVEEGKRMGLEPSRTEYLIDILRTKKQIFRQGIGLYRAREDEAPAPLSVSSVV